MSAVLQESDEGVNTSEISLRPMSADDLPGIIAIEQSAYPHPWTLGIFRDCMRVGYSCWILAHGRVVVGYGVLSIAVGESHILNLCVHPDFQGQGWGKYMLYHLLRLARQHNADTALLEVRPSNRPALELYSRMGFNEVGVRRGYYPDERGREDALILAMDLTMKD